MRLLTDGRSKAVQQGLKTMEDKRHNFSNPIRATFAGGCCAKDEHGAASALAPSATINLRRLFMDLSKQVPIVPIHAVIRAMAQPPLPE